MATGQHARINSWGLKLSPVKYYAIKFKQSEIYFPEYGTIDIKNSTKSMFRSDINVYLSRLVNRTFFEYGIGLRSDEYSMNPNAIGSANYLSQQSILVSNYTLQSNIHFGYVLAGNRSVHILVKGGVFYNLFTFKRDYNYINTLLKSAFRDEIIINLLGEPLVVNLHDNFSMPRTTFSTAVLLESNRIGVGLCYDYCSENIDLFKSKKPALIKQAQQVRLELSFLFGNNYTQK